MTCQILHYSRHALDRMFQRGISPDVIERIAKEGSVIATYPDDKPYPKTQIECPQAILVGLHMNAENLAAYMKEQTAIKLFKDGQLSSGTAAAWLNMPRVHFLLLAMS
ncbi:MAG: UPF0175 family protein [Sulfuricella sp.]